MPSAVRQQISAIFDIIRQLPRFRQPGELLMLRRSFALLRPFLLLK
jgi:hypothetical protein